MATKRNHLISEKELDELLRREFLSLDFNQTLNAKLMETISTQTIPHQLLPVNGLIKMPVFLTAVTAATLILLTTVYLMNKTNFEEKIPSPAITGIKKMPQTATLPSEPVPGKPQQAKKNSIVPAAKDPAPSFAEATKVEMTEEEKNLIPFAGLIDESGSLPQFEKDQKSGSAYTFPVLTEKEKKNNEKEKKRICKQAAKLNKYIYPPITGNKAAGDYYMLAYEVSNLDFRTFLFDLLIQNKKEEFLKAKPAQDAWINAAGRHTFDYLSKVYFSEKKYNDNPVVNISAEGAEIYCRWLSELLQTAKAKGETERDLVAMLPNENEWLYAASVGVLNAPYPWFKDSIQNHQNRFLANFCIQKLKEKFNRPISYPPKYTINLNAYTSVGAVLNDSTVATTLVYSYNPNDFLLYCMSGNVSELVYANDGSGPKTKGGNWASDFEHLKLNSEDEFKGNLKASPMIGFRVLLKENK